MNNLKSKILQLAKDNAKQVVDWRRHIHANPELSFQEYNTRDYISATLTELGVEHEKGVAETGVVAIIKGKNPDKINDVSFKNRRW